jgi:hypothetical protein
MRTCVIFGSSRNSKDKKANVLAKVIRRSYKTGAKARSECSHVKLNPYHRGRRALAEAEDCLAEAIAGYLVRRERVPESTYTHGDAFISLDPLLSAKAALNNAMLDTGLSRTELVNYSDKEMRYYCFGLPYRFRQ